MANTKHKIISLYDPESRLLVPGHNPIVQQPPETFIDERELAKHKKHFQGVSSENPYSTFKSIS